MPLAYSYSRLEITSEASRDHVPRPDSYSRLEITSGTLDTGIVLGTQKKDLKRLVPL
jgi:hypothetical protein